MYNIAVVDEAICASTSCNLCVTYCPEPDTILWNPAKKLAVVVVDRCKGCILCEVICNDMAKKHAIKMVSRNDIDMVAAKTLVDEARASARASGGQKVVGQPKLPGQPGEAPKAQAATATTTTATATATVEAPPSTT